MPQATATATPVQATHRTITPNTVDTTTFSGQCDVLRVVNRGNADLYFRLDGVDPIVEGDESRVVLANSDFRIVAVTPSAQEVRVISRTAVPYSLECVMAGAA